MFGFGRPRDSPKHSVFFSQVYPRSITSKLSHAEMQSFMHFLLRFSDFNLIRVESDKKQGFMQFLLRFFDFNRTKSYFFILRTLNTLVSVITVLFGKRYYKYSTRVRLY